MTDEIRDKLQINIYSVRIISLSEFLMVAIMASGMVFFMTLFMTLLREGLVPDFHMQWMSSFATALAIVFPLALGMFQIAKRVVSRLLKQEWVH